MSPFFSTIAAVLLPIASAVAQTTGVPGINDYTLNGLVSGSSSCTQLCFATPTNLTMAVQTVPGAIAVVVWTDCPCRGCAFPWPANTCVPPIPFGTAAPCSATNQSLDFVPIPGCNILFQGFLFANAAGLASQTLALPPLGSSAQPCALRFTTQAVVLDPCGLGGPPLGAGPFVLTQAYDVGF